SLPRRLGAAARCRVEVVELERIGAQVVVLKLLERVACPPLRLGGAVVVDENLVARADALVVAGRERPSAERGGPELKQDAAVPRPAATVAANRLQQGAAVEDAARSGAWAGLRPSQPQDRRREIDV